MRWLSDGGCRNQNNSQKRQNGQDETKRHGNTRQAAGEPKRNKQNARKDQEPRQEIQGTSFARATTLTGSEGVAPPSLGPMFLGQQCLDLLHLGGKKGLHLLSLAVKLMSDL